MVRIFVGSLMIFFGTLLLAGLLALGQPSGLGLPALQVDSGSQREGTPSLAGWPVLSSLVEKR